MAFSSLTSISHGGYGSGRRRRPPPPPPTPSINAALNSGSARSAPISTSTSNGVTRVLSYGQQPVFGQPTVPQFFNDPRQYLRRDQEERGPQKPQPRVGRASLLESLNHPFAPGETITPRQTALLAEAVGLPGRTYSKAIVPGESGYQPGIRNPDDRTPSLFQITPSVQSAETQEKFERIASRFPGGYSNPIAAAKQAAFLAGDSADEGVSNYVGFNPSAPQGHLRGGERRAERILGGSLGSVAGEQAGRARRPLSTSELFYDPGINLADGQEVAPIGGHDTHVHFGSEDPRSLLRAARIAGRMGVDVRENPAFEQVDPVHTEGSMHYQDIDIPRQLQNSRLYRQSGAQGDVLGEALDLTGTPDQLAGINRRLARLSGAPVTGTQSSTSMPGAGTSVGAPPTSPSSSTRAPSLRDILPSGGSGGAQPTSGLAPRVALQPRTREEEEDEEYPSLLDLYRRLGR